MSAAKPTERELKTALRESWAHTDVEDIYQLLWDLEKYDAKLSGRALMLLEYLDELFGSVDDD